MKKTESVKIDKESFKNSLKIFQFIKPYIGYFIAAMAMIVLGSLIFVMLPGIIGEMIKTADGNGEYSFTVNQLALGLIVLIFFQGILSFLRTVFFANVSERGIADLRKKLYANVISQPFSFYEQNRVGDLSSRLTADVEKLQNAFSVTLGEFIRQVVILIAGIAIIGYLTPKLSLIMLFTIPVVVVLSMVFGRIIKRLSKERQERIARSNVVVEESLQSFGVVKAYANEAFETKRYGKAIESVLSYSLKFARSKGVFFIFIFTFLFGGIIFIMWQGALLVQSGDMQSGDLVGFSLYTVFLGAAIAGLGSFYTELAGAVGATDRIQKLLELYPEINLEDSANDTMLPITGDISLRNVEFSYPTRPDIPVLKDVSLNIKEGSKVALVGQSGSGKSTIINLLMRFYDIQSGLITVDNQDIRDYNITQFRKSIAVVPQDVILFGGTIGENIIYGKPNATHEELIIAAEKSNCMEFIEKLPEGFDTIVGERGIRLSGGQRQRVAIARAILRDPKILFLDEATSSLDAESEKLVQDALDRLMVGRTSIIIAHRLSTIKHADTIYVLHNGEIVESGTHNQLIQNPDGVYKQLASLQFDLEII